MDYWGLLIAVAIFAAGYFFGVESYKRKTRYAAEVVPDRGWRCPNCGKTHQSYEYVCSCGFDRSRINIIDKNDNGSDSLSADTIEELKKYKGLMDEGILTPEEFDVKKKQLLEL